MSKQVTSQRKSETTAHFERYTDVKSIEPDPKDSDNVVITFSDAFDDKNTGKLILNDETVRKLITVLRESPIGDWCGV